ncbi:MAG: regulatory iron-sulfur-containing complex subunit RicT [Anaerolineales bacterium]
MEDNQTVPVVEQCIVGLRFQPIGKIYHFDATNFKDVQEGDYVVVETSRGTQLGQIAQFVKNPDRNTTIGLKSIVRIATPQDLVVHQKWEQRESEALATCRAKVSELKITDIKLVSAEYSLDGSRLIFIYSSENGEKTDLKALKRSMQRTFQQSRVEMHLIGPRDVAKTLGGMGACGLECRCCAAFLTEFSPISIKMAKEQGISLTPTEITGMCGRLRCCLVYEYEQYVEARKQLPKRGKMVITPRGNGKVVDVNPLMGSVLIEMEQGGRHEFLQEDLQPLEEYEALKKKTDDSCENCPEEKWPVMKKGKRRPHARPR